MRPSRIRQVWEQDRVVLNGWLAIPSSFSAEIMAKQGWDSLTIDMQHGLIDYQAAVEMLTGISTTEVAPLVRVPWLDSGIIMKMLDAGSYGILCPMINNRRDAEELVSACRYPPRGHRSYGPIRALPYAGADYLEHADETIVVLALVETKEALNNLDDIMTVEGLDGVYVGPSDLSLSLGLQPKIEPDEPKLLEAFDTITGDVGSARHSGGDRHRHRVLREADGREGLPIRHGQFRRPPGHDGRERRRFRAAPAQHRPGVRRWMSCLLRRGSPRRQSPKIPE